MHIPTETNTFTAKSEPLFDLLHGINKHKIALPQFQRPWVWMPEMVRDLIVSVAYRYPAGSLLTIPVISSTFALRPFEGCGDELETQPNLMVLDGQQRLTSLYQALYGQEGIFFKAKRYYFYLDIETLLSDPDGSIDVGDPYFDKALFYVSQESSGKRFRYKELQKLYELSTSDQEFEAGVLPLNYVFDPNGQLATWKEKYLLAKSGTETATFIKFIQQWDRLVEPWLSRIRTYRFPVVELNADMPLGAICHVFEKVNSTGVPLDVFDLCVAILWAQGFQLNKVWEQTAEALMISMPMQPLNGAAFLQGLALISSLERKRQSPGEKLAVACRKQDLMALKKADVEQWWAPLEAGYAEAARFMANAGILAERILPYSTQIVPLTAIFADLLARKNGAAVAAAWPKIERWYWCCVFSQRYGSQGETNAAQDFEQVIGWIDSGQMPDVVKTFNFRSDILQEIMSIRNAIYKGVLCLLAARGAKDFGGQGKLTTALFFDTAQDHHHIFPRSALSKLGIDDPSIDSIVNKTLICSSVNKSIGGARPGQYVKRLRSNLGQDIFDQVLESHLINSEILAADDWLAFVNDRREKLRKLIESACGGVMQPFSDGSERQELVLD